MARNNIIHDLKNVDWIWYAWVTFKHYHLEIMGFNSMLEIIIYYLMVLLLVAHFSNMV